MSEGFCGLSPLLLAQLCQDVRHGGARFGRMRIVDESLKVLRVHPGADLGEARRFLRSSSKRCFARVTSRTIHFLNQDQPPELRIEFAGCQSRNDHLPKYDRNDAEQQRGSKGDQLDNRCDGRVVICPRNIPTIF